MSEGEISSSGPLSGMLVVAIEQAVAAPLCTSRLADAGARVIKIERAEGETARHYDAHVDGQSAYFVWLNRGKQSAVLDLKSKADLALLHRMIARADVFVQNLAPGAIDRLGLSASFVGATFPKLISVGIVGYGQDTDYAQMRAYDMLVQAESGVCSVTGSPEAAVKVGVSAADIATGMTAHAAILEALLSRAKSGRGQSIEIAMFDAMADWMTVPLLQFEQAGRETRRHGLAHASIYPYRSFGCRDGKSVIIAIQQPSEWRRFCSDVLSRPDLVSDGRTAANSARVANRAFLDTLLESFFAGLDCDQAIDRLEAAQIAWGRLTEVRNLGAHPALRRISATTPSGKTIGLPRPASLGVSAKWPQRIPGLGEHTEQIRAEYG